MSKNNMVVLLSTLLKSSSGINTMKHCADSKKRGKIVASYVGLGLLYFFLVVFCVLVAIGYGIFGLADSIPVFSATVISTMCLFFTLIKSGGYIFEFKDYDLLMSFPIEVSDIVKCKFLYMYVKSLVWVLSISFASMIGYGFFAKPKFYVYILWVVLSFFVPIIPMLAASLVGAVFTAIGSGFKFKKAVQTILMFMFILFSFSLRFIIDGVFRNNEVEDVIGVMSEKMESASRYIFSAAWFGNSITKGNIIAGLLLIGVSVLLLVVFARVLSINYRKINSRLKSHSVRSDFKMGKQKQRSAVMAVAFKEFRRMIGSSNYMVNASFGFVMVMILAVASLFFDPQTIVNTITEDAPISADLVLPAIPLVIYFFTGMVATTCITPSLEGKNYWILQSLPISKMDIYKGKMLFNLWLGIPSGVFSVIILGFRFGGDIIDILLFVILVIALNLFSTIWGLLCGIKFMKLDWEYEIEIIKHSTALVVYLFPNLIITMIMIVVVIILGMIVSAKIVTGILVVLVSLFAAVLYLILRSVIANS